MSNKKHLETKIVTIEVSKLIPYKDNPRIHTPEQVEQIKKSILKLGYNSSIVVDENNMILAGHGRAKAIKELGIEKVDCILKDNFSEKEKKAYIVADNATNDQSKFDLESLEKVANDLLDNFDFDFKEELGINFEELEQELSQLEKQADDYDNQDKEEFKPKLNDSEEKNPIVNMVFSISTEQEEEIKKAIQYITKNKNNDLYDPMGLNSNKNGNSLYLLALEFNRLNGS